MNIAILGANSHLASDLALRLAQDGEHQLHLFSRQPEVLMAWQQDAKLSDQHLCLDYAAFNQHQYDAVLNFVGVGDPRHANLMGAAIFDVTLKYDEMALAYLKTHSACRYVFMSSGSVYGGNFAVPASPDSCSTIPINNLQPQDWYGAAKLHAECRHRSLPNLAIHDLRVFNYFSCTQDLEAKFFLSELLHCIQNSRPFRTNAGDMVRDFVGPADFHQLINKVLHCPLENRALDIYSAAPIEKFSLLNSLQSEFNLTWSIADSTLGVNATGTKKRYYSTNRAAAQIGYTPQYSSLENIRTEFARMIGNAAYLHAARMKMRSKPMGAC